jgi:hypothetical protein
MPESRQEPAERLKQLGMRQDLGCEGQDAEEKPALGWVQRFSAFPQRLRFFPNDSCEEHSQLRAQDACFRGEEQRLPNDFMGRQIPAESWK